MDGIYRYYNAKVHKSPHVLGHYAAGARLIGLTEKQMAQHLATLNQSGDENSDSPYAQPVSLFSAPGKFIKPAARRNGKIRLRIVNRKFKESESTKLDGESEDGGSEVRYPVQEYVIILMVTLSLVSTRVSLIVMFSVDR